MERPVDPSVCVLAEPPDSGSLQRAADRDLARRGLIGAGWYPAAVVALSLIDHAGRDHPQVFLLAGGGLGALGLIRLAVGLGFDRLYARHPRLWRALFTGTVLAMATVWSVLATSQIVSHWPGLVALYAIILTAGLSASGVSTLNPRLDLAHAFTLIIHVPLVMTGVLCADRGGVALSSITVANLCFLLILARFEHRQYWSQQLSRELLKRRSEDLEAARESAERANRAKSDFLANMSHEIRTPLNGVLGMTELVLQTSLSAQQREYLETARYSGETLLDLVSDILDFSKIEAGKLDLCDEDFSVRETLGRTLQALAHGLRGKPVELVCDIDANVPDFLHGDELRFRQIVVNLVNNAIKFTARGEIVLRLCAEPCTNGRVLLHGEVSDTGIGIPPDKVGTIFQAFTQADSSTSRRYGGTGLGLAICSHLTRLMNGEIEVASRVGEGTTFSFTLRLGVRPQAPAPAPASRCALVALVVEENERARDVIERLLTGMGATCHAFADVGKLRQWHAADRVAPAGDIVLIGVPPGQNGAASPAPNLADDPGLCSLPVIVMAVSGNNPGEEPLARNDARVRIPKPVYATQLRRVLEQIAADPHPLRDRADGPVAAWRPAAAALRVLVAEDNAVNRKFIGTVLERLGHQVTLAENGQQAVERWREGDHDVVLMDVQMPELDGLEATQIIRSEESGSGVRTPIIALTAHAFGSDRQRCLDAGMDGYLTKPVQIAALQRVLKPYGATSAAPASPIGAA